MATLLIHDFPEGFYFGIDFNIWQIGPKFKGVSNIPVGPHLIFSSATEMETRSSRFITFSEDVVLIEMRWSKDTEQLKVVCECESGERNEYLLRQFLANLGPYPDDQAAVWRRHAEFLDSAVLSSIQPVNKIGISSDPQGPSLFWSEIPKVKNNADASALSMAHVDKSSILNFLLQRVDGFCLVSELHVSFLLFFIGQNFSALEQWKRVFSLFSQCPRAAEEQTAVYEFLGKSICMQIELLPSDFLIDPLTEYSIVGVAMADLLEIANLPMLEEVIVRKFGKNWRDLALPDEDLPTIVD